MTRTALPRNRDRASTPHRIAAAALALGVIGSIFFSGNAHAQEVAHEAPVVEASPSYAIGPEAYLGGFGGSGHNGGMILGGVGVLGHYGLLEGGAIYEGGTQVLSGSMTGAAGLLGVGYDVTPHFRVSLLGEAGEHFYDRIGSDVIFGSHPGVSGNLPYAGGRAGAQWSIGRDVRFTIGLWLFVRDDLGRDTKTNTAPTTGLFGPSTETSTETLGQWQTGLALRLGIEGGSF